MHLNATMNDNCPDKFKNLDRYQAREALIAELKALELLEKIEKYTTMLPYGDRSNAVLEPMLTDQWFVKMDMAKQGLELVNSGKIQFHPHIS